LNGRSPKGHILLALPALLALSEVEGSEVEGTQEKSPSRSSRLRGKSFYLSAKR
jgi:hypothetical protein